MSYYHKTNFNFGENMENLTIKNVKNTFIERLSERIMIAGPCSIESLQQLDVVALELVRHNVQVIRGGAFKPRTSPYSFQGMGIEGLKFIDFIRKKYQLYAISEIVDPRDIELGIKYTDIIQIGSRNMCNFALLKEIGKTKHPVLLKRGMMSTIEEFLLAAEYIVSNGNSNVILCERGIRTFETETRNTLDIACIPIVKSKTNLPIIVDLSHSLGRKDIISPIARAALGAGADGIMVEIHPDPPNAYSDNNQQLDFSEFSMLMNTIRNI